MSLSNFKLDELDIISKRAYLSVDARGRELRARDMIWINRKELLDINKTNSDYTET